MLFTSDTDKSFEATGCDNEDFGYTPLSAIDVHWTYKGGDKTIDMGYINVEVLRKGILTIFCILGKEWLTLDDFVQFYSHAIEVEASEHEQVCEYILDNGVYILKWACQLRHLRGQNLCSFMLACKMFEIIDQS